MEKLTATHSLTKNAERELNQLRNTVAPQISNLGLMIKNGDDGIKKKLMIQISQLRLKILPQ